MKRLMIPFLLFLAASPSLSFAAKPMFKALLVSIEKYENAPLAFAGQDIEKFSGVLMTRYDCETQAFIDKAPNGIAPPKESAMRKIEDWCTKLGDGDTAVLYLSGHGVKDGENKLYLAMINFDGKNFDKAAIPLDWIRERFEKCNAKNKLLLVDTCFAGANKNVGIVKQATGDDIHGAFRDLPGVATIASCGADEKSWIWTKKKHSLFTYWLIEAFKGHADSDGDRILTFNELSLYLTNNVSWTANKAFKEEQSPVVMNARAGKDFSLPLFAVDLSQLIDDIAEQIDLRMLMETKFTHIGVPVFTSGLSKSPDTSFDPRYGTLPSWVSNQLRNSLQMKSQTNGGGYKVVSENALREALASNEITTNNLGTDKTADLKVGSEAIPVLVNGRMEFFDDKAGTIIRTTLLDTEGKNEAGQAGGAAMLSVTELGMTNASGKFAIAPNPPPAQPKPPVEVQNIGIVPAQQIEATDEFRIEQAKPHPMADPNSDFKVEFEVRTVDQRNASYEKRDVKIDGNHCYLPLSKGEEYRIKVENNTGQLIFARILVDGLNTLSQPEKVQAKGAYLVYDMNPNSEGAYVLHPRASLSDARPWVMEAKGIFAIQGFYNANGKSDTLHRFQVGDADQSAAAHMNYTEQLGTITIGFFEADANNIRGGGNKKEDVGTQAGPAETVVVKPFLDNVVPGKMMAVYNIRYMTPETLHRIAK